MELLVTLKLQYYVIISLSTTADLQVKLAMYQLFQSTVATSSCKYSKNKEIQIIFDHLGEKLATLHHS